MRARDPKPTPTRDEIRQSIGGLWTQKEAAAFLGVTTRYVRDSSCPKLLLPGNGKAGQPLVRYDPVAVRAWAQSWRAGAVNERRAS